MRRKNEEQGVFAGIVSAAGVSKTVDESGATQPYLFTITSGTTGFDITERGQTNGNTQTFTSVSDLTVVGSIFDDSFKVNLAPVAKGATISLDGEAGTDSLTANFGALSGTFLVNADGSVDSDVGRFRNFEAYDLTFAGGTSRVRTSASADFVTISSGDITLDAGGGADTVTTAAGSGFHLDGGSGADVWNARFDKTGNTAVTYVDGVFNNGASTATGFERVSLGFTGSSTFSVSGDVSSTSISVSTSGQNLQTFYDLSKAHSAASVSAGSYIGHDYYSQRIGVGVSLGADKVYFGNSLIASTTVIGTSFDDSFTMNYVEYDNIVSYDGGAGLDKLKLELFGDYFSDYVPNARFIVHGDGTIDCNFQHFANFEQFDIVTGPGAYIATGDLADVIEGGGTLLGKGGDDQLTAIYANTILGGGDGNDTLTGQGTTTASYADAGSAVVVSTSDGVQNTGGGGVDTLTRIASLIGSDFDDTLTGNDLNNTLDGGAGDDTLTALGGTDTASYASASAGVTVSLAVATSQNTIAAGRDILSGFENLTGSAFNDVLAGDAGDNVLNGGDGDDKASFAAATAGVTVDLRITGAQATAAGVGTDTLVSIEGIVGSAFDDVINGDFRDNTIEGGLGNDKLDGTTGFDVLSYSGATAGVAVDLRLTTAQDTGGAGVDTIANFEGIAGSTFADTLIADGGNNRLIGGGGDDRLTGGYGSDELRGGDGIDTAVYQVGTWSDYAVDAGKGGSYTITNLARGDVDTLYSVEKVQFGDQTFAIGDLVNAAPRARADKVGGVIEAGSDRPGQDAAEGNVLANDRDANLGTPGLGETLTVSGIATGRGADSFTAVGTERTIDGRFGTLTIHGDGTFDYLLDNGRAATDRLGTGQTGRDIFTYQITDAHGATSTAALVVAIKGSDDAPAVHASAFGNDVELPVGTAHHGADLLHPADVLLA